jgi:PAS domain S-box-containing protein
LRIFHKDSYFTTLLHRNLRWYISGRTHAKVRLLNWAVVLSLVALVATVPLNVYTGDYEMLRFNTIIFVLLALYFPAISRTGSKSIAVFYVFGILFSFLLFADLHYGKQTDLILGFLPLGLAMTLLFDLREWKTASAMLLIPIALTVLREVNWFEVAGVNPIGEEHLPLVKLSSLGILLVGFVAFVYLYLRDLDRNQRRHEVTEQRFFSVVQNTSDLIWALNRQFELTAFNAPFEQTYLQHNGQGPVMGQYAFQHSSPEDEEKWKDTLRQAFSGQALTFENTNDGVTYEYLITPVMTNHGVESLNIIGRNITRRKEVEQALLTEQRRLEEIANTLPGVVYQVETSPSEPPKFTFVGHNAAEVFGIPARQIMQRPTDLEELIHPDDRQAMRVLEAEAHQEHRDFYLEVRFILPNGLRWMAISSKPSASRPHVRTGLIIDITDRMAQNQETLRAKNMLEGIHGNLDEGIFRFDQDLQLVYANAGFYRQFGLNPDQDALSVQQLFSSQTTLSRLRTQLQEHGEIATREVLLRRKNGQLFSGLLSVKVVQQGPKTMYDGTLRDITPERDGRHDLLVAKEAAEEAVREKNAFLSTVSHEIRTPLNAITGLTALMKAEPLTDKTLEYVHAMELSSRNMLGLVTDILDYARAESGKIKLRQEWISLEPFLKNLEKTGRGLLNGKNIGLFFHKAPDLPAEVETDEGRLTQILTNVLANSIKFTNQGEVNIEIAYNYGAQELVCMVKDTGIGIPKMHHDDIFKSFSQGNMDIARKYGGTGLGLAITRYLTELFGGSIAFESEPNQGSTFTMAIPAQHRGQMTKSTHTVELAPSADSSLAGMRILLAEDNMLNVMVAKQMLKNAHAEVQVAENGRICLEMLNYDRPDLILMDLQMPELDGLETTRIIRQREADQQLPRLPIIALTANAFEETREQVLQAGMDDFLSKPIHPEDLFQVLSKYLTTSVFNTNG